MIWKKALTFVNFADIKVDSLSADGSEIKEIVMKRKILAAILLLVMCFTFAGCGENTADNDNRIKKPGKIKLTSIVGSWECEDIEVTDNGEKIDKDTVKTMFGEDFSSIFEFSAYSDGVAYITLMGNESTASWKKSKEKEYEIVQDESESEHSGTMTAELDGESLIVTVTETYESDGKEQNTQLIFKMNYLGKKSRLIEGWDVVLDEREVYDMSNAMAGGLCIEADEMLYGDYGGNEWGKGAFTAAKIIDGKLADHTVIAKYVNVFHLNEYNGDIYGIFDYNKIIKVEGGKTEVETVYEGVCDYLQVTEDGIYFTDEKNHYCRIDNKGQNKETILEKEVFYPYQISPEFVIYQDDADGETLHVYNLKNGDDVKISDIVSYEPMLCGDYLYFYTPGSNEDMVYMCRINMYSGKKEKAKKENLMYGYYVTPDGFSVAMGGFVTAEFDEWDNFADKSSAGVKFYPIYSNGEFWITKSYGENFMGTRTFGSDDEKSIGYSYARGE